MIYIYVQSLKEAVVLVNNSKKVWYVRICVVYNNKKPATKMFKHATVTEDWSWTSQLHRICVVLQCGILLL